MRRSFEATREYSAPRGRMDKLAQCCWDAGADAASSSAQPKKRRKFNLPFKEACVAVQQLGLTSSEKWNQWCSKNREERERLQLPGNPRTVYSVEWVDWQHFLLADSSGCAGGM